VRQLFELRHPELFARLRRSDDRTFLEPLLFAYLTGADEVLAPEQLVLSSLEHGETMTVPVVANERGVVSVPGIGDWSTDRANARLQLRWAGNGRVSSLASTDGPVVSQFEPPVWIMGRDIDVCRYPHPLLTRLYVDDDGLVVTPEVSEVIARHASQLARAFTILSEVFEEYAAIVRAVTRRVMLFHGPAPNSFASLAAHGMVFLNTRPEDDEVFFVEDLLHQCGHVVFNAATPDQQRLFSIDPNTPIGAHTGVDDDTRSIYVLLHGVFTEAAMVDGMDRCLEADVFPSRQRHELQGRLAYALRRFAADLRYLLSAGVLAREGAALVAALVATYEDVSQRRRDLATLRLSNQPYAFGYGEFVLLNPLPDRVAK
jgi:HEXXH motif-containing protein